MIPTTKVVVFPKQQNVGLSSSETECENEGFLFRRQTTQQELRYTIRRWIVVQQKVGLKASNAMGGVERSHGPLTGL